MKFTIQFLMTFIISCFAAFSFAFAAPQVISIKTEKSYASEKVIFSFNSSTKHQQVFLLDNPARLVMDLEKVNGRNIRLPNNYRGNILSAIRFGEFDSNTSRIVFDLKEQVKSATLSHKRASYNQPYSITLELLLSANKTTLKPIKPTKPIPKTVQPKSIASFTPKPLLKPRSTSNSEKSSKPKKTRRNAPLIIIDAGHGGKDPGAVSKSKKYEKNITLTYAKRLAEKLKSTGRYRVKLTRESDKFIFLSKRVRIARRAKGDIFISIHADSALEKSARGLSIYTVSEKSSDKEAAALAAQENKADYVAGVGVDVAAKDEQLVNILLDLTRRDTKNKSSKTC